MDVVVPPVSSKLTGIFTAVHNDRCDGGLGLWLSKRQSGPKSALKLV